MANSPRKRADRDADSLTHHEPYPDRLHRHLTSAVEATGRIEAPDEGAPGLPTPGELVSDYGAPDGLNTSRSEGGSDE